MERSYPFSAFDVHRCYPTDPAVVDTLARKTVAQGHVGPASPPLSELAALMLRQEMSPHRVLQICLLTMELFQDCADDQIVDLHLTPGALITYPNRPWLIALLADALLLYERIFSHSSREQAESPTRLLEAWRLVVQGYNRYAELHTLRSPKLRSKPSTPKEIKGLIEKGGAILKALPPDALRFDFSQWDREYLVEGMETAFKETWPHKTHKCSDTVVLRSIASILQTLGIETGTLEHITARIRKRRARRSRRSPLRS